MKGRPAPNGRKVQCCVRLTPDVHAYCQEKGYNVLENAVRETPAFIAWQHYSKQRVDADGKCR